MVITESKRNLGLHFNVFFCLIMAEGLANCSCIENLIMYILAVSLAIRDLTVLDTA